MKCIICQQEFSKIEGLSKHLKSTHKVNVKDYYDTNLKENIDEGICKNCGNETEFLGLKGYRQFCNRTCFWQYTTQLDEVKKKRKKTNKERYGVEELLSINGNRTCSEEAVKKIKKTKKDRYKDENYNNIEQVKKTKKERYKDEYYNNHDKAIETLNDKYKSNVNSPFGLKEVHNKSIETLTDRYSTDGTIITSPLQISEFRKKALGHSGNMTVPEKKMNEFLKNRKFDYKYSFDVNGKNFDFAIFKNGELDILIEIDGLYFHGLKEDSNGKHVRGEKDCERFNKVPEGVKFIVCDENKLEDCFSEILKEYNIDYTEWIKELVEKMPKEFPYPKYSMERMKKDYEHLKNNDYNKNSRVGNSIIRHYHESIWEARVGNNLSPVECWNNKESLEKVIKNRIIYSSSLSTQAIADGFNVCKEAPKVSVFRPILAKYIIEKYLKEYNEVFDPFSGFSGRMLGCCACGKHYIGQDINLKHIDESNKIIKDFELNAEVKCVDIFQSTGTYKCLFTCSPYSLKEKWNENETDYTCDEWIDECLKRFKCDKYVFVVDNTEKYKDNIVEEIDNISHFSKNKEKIIVV